MRLLAVALVVASSLWGALLTSDAGAISVYDDVYKTTDSLISCRGVDYTLDQIMFDIHNDGPILQMHTNVGMTKAELAQEMRDVIDSPTGAWYASKYNAGWENQSLVFGYSNFGYVLNWYTNAVSYSSSNYNLLYLECSTSSPNIPFRIVRGNSFMTPYIAQGSENERILDNYYVSGNVDYNYPTGYEGQQISNEAINPPVPLAQLNYWVNYTFSNSTYNIKFKYLNKATDPVSSAPDPELLDFRLYSQPTGLTDWENAPLVCEGVFSITDEVDTYINDKYECGVLDANNFDYRLRVRVDIGTIVNENSPNHHLATGYNYMFLWADTYFSDGEISSNGSTTDCVPGAIDPLSGVVCTGQKQIDWLSCVIDVNDCLSLVNNFFSVLSFGIIQFDRNVWTHQPECYQLQTLHDWLNIPNNSPNRVLCPVFDSHVRNTITPFITFFFGLIIATFISQRDKPTVNVRGI